MNELWFVVVNYSLLGVLGKNLYFNVDFQAGQAYFGE